VAEQRFDRRTLLRGGLLAGGALLGGGAAVAAVVKEVVGASSPSKGPHGGRSGHGGTGQGTTAARGQGRGQGPRPEGPNILVIVVDQLRAPQWFTASPVLAAMLPNITRLRNEGVSFERHYTASNDCTPARAALLTGLYTHQTGCMITGGSTLDPGFPTWGSMLRDHGYESWWFGKWHLTHGDNHWALPLDEGALERYGFAGGTYPSPDGGPGQGWRVDPQVAGQFEEWFAENGASSRPWCTTASFVNPHDIAWWHKWTERVPSEAGAPALVRGLPPNFETPEMLRARNKPLLQRSFQQTAAASFGAVRLEGHGLEGAWMPFLDLYVKLQRRVDEHVGRVLHALESRPEIAANTVVLFTSDHGEYGGSHGLRGKGGGAYEEAIRVPFIVRDPRRAGGGGGAEEAGGESGSGAARGPSGGARGGRRTQLTSSVDVAPLLLSIATGSNEWRRNPRYSHIAGRADLAGILADPGARGRPYVLHTTDEIVTEFATEPYAADAPLHVVALRTARAKFATYADWTEGGIAPVKEGAERELYDYRTKEGRMETRNRAARRRSARGGLERRMERMMERVLHAELRGLLPRKLEEAHGLGFENYFLTAKKAARGAAAARLRRVEAETGGTVSPYGPGSFNEPLPDVPEAPATPRAPRAGSRRPR
jgi:arylsulfatase A-like enzyme